MLMSGQIAYFFVYHGSRDPRGGQSAHALAEQVMDVIGETAAQITGDRSASSRRDANAQASPCLATIPWSVGALELAEIPLHQQLERFSRPLAQQGIDQVRVIPLFLLPGAHVRDDIPMEVSLAQQALGSSIQLMVCPYLGSHARIASYLGDLMPKQTPLGKTARVLMSHGSKRPGGNEPVEAIATQLDAVTAYWSVPPNLERCLDDLVESGVQEITVMPYFLFSGGITDAIAQTVTSYRQRFSHVRFHTGQPIGECGAIAPLVADLAIPHSLKSGIALV